MIQVFVFSPKGDLYALPKGSSIIDFAYRVHSELGNRCIGGKVLVILLLVHATSTVVTAGSIPVALLLTLPTGALGARLKM